MPTRTETLMWTALPGGLSPADGSGTQRLRLSVFLSPRLETSALAGTISEFPDFSGTRSDANWAALMRKMQFKVEFMVPGLVPVRRTVEAASIHIVSEQPDTELWDKIFPDTMPYKTFKFHDLKAATINTFSVKNVHGIVKQQYQTVAATPLMVHTVPTLSKLVKLPGITNPPLLRVLPTATRVAVASALGARTAAASTAPQDTNVSAFEAFHTPYEKPVGFTPPPIPPMDFHKALSALGNYPGLLKKLGIVVTIEVPFTTSIKSADRVRVLPVWGEGLPVTPYLSWDQSPITRKSASPWTACAIGSTVKTIGRSLVTVPTSFAARSQDGTISGGYLVARSTSTTSITADKTRLFNYNVDVATAKLLATAASAAKINPPVEQQVATGAQTAALTPGIIGTRAQIDASLLAARAAEPTGLPTLGQPVISMAVPGLASQMTARFAAAAAKNAYLVAGQDESITNYAEDVTRGYRVDVWDSVTRHWHPLCGRVGTYAYRDSPITWGDQPTLADEGWVQFGAISAPETALGDDPPSSMRIHESVFDWSGWSLSVPRPGAAISEPDAQGNVAPSRTFTGPDAATHEIGHYLHPDLPIDVHFSVPAGTLPRLRFGANYRFRARAVDLAGQSVAFSAGSTTANPGGSADTLTTVSRAITHQRYEPVNPPTVVLDEPTKPGESPEVLLVRTFSPAAGGTVKENTSRHIAPPRTSVQMAETAGGLDASTPGKPVDKALWSTLASRDAWDFPKHGDGTQAPVSEWEPTPVMPSPVPYLPDPYSKGAALKGLPGASTSTTTRTIATGVRYKGVAIPTSTSTVKVTNLQIDFNDAGSKWYDKKPFKIVVQGIEAIDPRVIPHAVPLAPAWDAAQRVLTVQLPKAEQMTVDLSSFMNTADIAKMGVYTWGLEKHLPVLSMVRTPSISVATAAALGAAGAAVAGEADASGGASVAGSAETAAAQVAAVSVNTATKVPTSTSTAYTSAVNALITTSAIGANWMITPSAKLKLVHAVDKPLIKPAFTSRAHAERKAGDVHAAIVDWMPIHGKSTSKFEVTAAWNEPVDTGSGTPQWGDTAVAHSGHAFTLTPATSATTILNAGAPTPSMVSNYWGTVPSGGMLINTRDLSAQRHFFGDTKHRYVAYTATETSRFEQHFSDRADVGFNVTSAPKSLHVPSSARPAPPQIDYVVPTFGWVRSATSSTRKGGGLRVYLDRPWFSSGADECLAVVLWQVSSSNTYSGAAEPFVTQWGQDPMFTTAGHLPSYWPQLSNFLRTKWKRSGLTLAEAPSGTRKTVMAAAYLVNYDPDSDRWYADIEIKQGSAYFPFIKLALARFQPYALAGLELSPVVIADFAQLTPDRTATISWAADRSSFTVGVAGETYSADYSGKRATVTVSLERKGSSASDAAWTAVTQEAELARQPRSAYEILHGITAVRWRGTVTMPTQVAGYDYRVVVREYEWHSSYGTDFKTTAVKRLVYAETMPVV